MTDHEKYMTLAIEQAQKALNEGEIPVGCVFVGDDGELLTAGHNMTNETKNGTRHAEIVAIDKFLIEKQGTLDVLSKSSLYVTCEPCIMCAAAIARVGIKNVYFGCKNERFGGNGSIFSVHEGLAGLPEYSIHTDIMHKEAINLFQTFYSTENRRAPDHKRKRKHK